MTPAGERELAVRMLRNAADVVDRGWTQGAMARNAAGGVATVGSPSAVCWCALGAIWTAMMAPDGRALESVWTVFQAHVGTGIDAWNDTSGRTAEQVSAAMRTCADRVERGEL